MTHLFHPYQKKEKPINLPSSFFMKKAAKSKEKDENHAATIENDQLQKFEAKKEAKRSG